MSTFIIIQLNNMMNCQSSKNNSGSTSALMMYLGKKLTKCSTSKAEMTLLILWIKNLLKYMYKSSKPELAQRKMLRLQLVVDKSSNISKFVFRILTILISALKSLFQAALLIHGIVTEIQLKL